MTRNKSTKLNLIFAAVFFLIFVVCIFVHEFTAQKKSGAVAIYLNGQVFSTFSTLDDTEIDVNGLCVVKCSNGDVFVCNASCPDKSCEKQGVLDKAPIICLPNRIVIAFLQPAAQEFDAVVN